MSDVITNTDGEIEMLGDVEVVHHFADAPGPDGPINWHYVTAGPDDGETIVFFHGNGESWWSWHQQIEHLATRYRILAMDLKGYGQSDKRDGNWHWENVAEEALGLIDMLGYDRFNVVAHDRGAVLADYLAGNHPERVLRYLRMAQIVHIWDPTLSPQAEWFADEDKAIEIFGNFFELRMSKMLKSEISEAHKARLIREQSYPGIGKAVSRYFRASSFAEQLYHRVSRLLRNMDFPVLLLFGDQDKGQPVHYYGDPANPATALFPNARLEWINGGGHFTTVDNPEEITRHLVSLLAEPV